MNEEKEAFLDRWSRLKREQPAEAPAVPQARAEAPPPPLPPVEELRPESDFTPFMNPKVEDGTRRAALKKLFADPHYSIPDPFEAYCEDYTQSEPIPETMLKAINRVRDVSLKGEETVAEEERLAKETSREASARAEPAEPEQRTLESNDAPGKQDA
jgi:hypothetical protein